MPADIQTAGPARAKAAKKIQAARQLARAAVAACQTLLDAKVTRVEAPGGLRKSIRLQLEDGSVIVTRRRSLKRARLEAMVLHALGARGAPVPKILAFDGLWMIQEDLGDQRLSQAFAESKKRKREAWLEAALTSLAECHRAGRDAGLERMVAVIGRKRGWLSRILTMPTHLGRYLNEPPPSYPQKELEEFLGIRRPAFIKWDARPGNAIAREDGTVAWFDWEHSGCRNQLDDLGWLMGDEFSPDFSSVEMKVLKKHLPDFIGDDEDPDEAMAYLSSFCTLHMCTRLTIIFAFKKGGPWWDAEGVLERDSVGVTRENAQALCQRAARWAARAPLMEPLAPWFEKLVDRLPEPNPEGASS